MTRIVVMMVRAEPYALIYAPAIKEHLRYIAPKYYSLIREKTEEQLRFEPDVESRNRKPLEQPAAFEAEWELRFGPDNCFRVFYQVRPEEREVHIVAVGRKDRQHLSIGGEEISL